MVEMINEGVRDVTKVSMAETYLRPGGRSRNVPLQYPRPAR